MTVNEFAAIAAALKSYYPRENILPTKEATELWYRALQDLSYPVAKAAIDKWVATNKWSPSIAEIREAAASVSDGEIDDWGLGWEKVLTAVRRHGLYGHREAMESLDDLTRKAVQCVGYRDICMSENISVERANFRTIYQDLAAREKTQRQMAVSLKDTINRLQTGNDKYLIGGE